LANELLAHTQKSGKIRNFWILFALWYDFSKSLDSPQANGSALNWRSSNQDSLHLWSNWKDAYQGGGMPEIAFR